MGDILYIVKSNFLESENLLEVKKLIYIKNGLSIHSRSCTNLFCFKEECPPIFPLISTVLTTRITAVFNFSFLCYSGKTESYSMFGLAI
jgi:hypothetical protein